MIGVCAGLFAGKPAPTVFVLYIKFANANEPVGAGLPAKAADQSQQILEAAYLSRIASVRAFNTGLSK